MIVHMIWVWVSKWVSGGVAKGMFHRTNHANGTRTMRMVQTLPNGCMFETAGALAYRVTPFHDGDERWWWWWFQGLHLWQGSLSLLPCLSGFLFDCFLSIVPHVDPHEPLHERGPRCMSTTNYARARMQPVLPTVLCSATNMAFLQPCEKSTRSQSMRAHVKRQV